MKNSIKLLVILFISISVHAQRTVEKSVKLSNNKEVFVHFKFANNIEVKQWNQSSIKVTATVHLNNGEGNKYFSLKSTENGEQLKVYSDFGNYFRKKRNWNQHNTTSINYIVYVPKKAKLKVKSISGSLEASSFSGSLTTDLISGDITLKKSTGPLYLKTVSGDVDVAISSGKIDAKTVTGTIYSDLVIKKTVSKHSSYSSKVKGTVNDGNDAVTLTTVSGNIYMRKE